MREGSGGAGKYRGGLGIERKVTARTPLTFNAEVDRMHCAPWGLEGGLDGAGNGVSLHLNEGAKKDFPNAKILMQRLRPGEGFTACSGGSGGFGPPVERDASRVAHDVAEGYISAEDAESVYGVVLSEDGNVDEAATKVKRSQKSRMRIAGR